jgi:hypothetical protein
LPWPPSCLFQGSFCHFHFFWWFFCFNNVDCPLEHLTLNASMRQLLEYSEMMHT